MCERVGVYADPVRKVAKTSTGSLCAQVCSWKGDCFVLFFLGFLSVAVPFLLGALNNRVKHNS